MGRVEHYIYLLQTNNAPLEEIKKEEDRLERMRTRNVEGKVSGMENKKSHSFRLYSNFCRMLFGTVRFEVIELD
jgi:hypothetical protein